jgi:hypothetical protein
MRRLMLCFAAGGLVAIGGWVFASWAGKSRTCWRSAAAGCRAVMGCPATSCPLEPEKPTSPPESMPDDAILQVSAAPAPIVIRDDEHAAGCPDANGDTHALMLPEWSTAVASAMALATPANEPAAVCPMVMPYCTDDEEAPKCKVPHMPLADEVVPMKHGVCAEACEMPEHFDHPDCQEDAHYHEQYPGVPYVGPATKPMPHSEKKMPPAVPAEEECTEPGGPAPRLHRAHYPGKGCGCDGCPARPDVDTMEYRRSDGGLNEYGPGPL